MKSAGQDCEEEKCGVWCGVCRGVLSAVVSAILQKVKTLFTAFYVRDQSLERCCIPKNLWACLLLLGKWRCLDAARCLAARHDRMFENAPCPAGVR